VCNLSLKLRPKVLQRQCSVDRSYTSLVELFVIYIFSLKIIFSSRFPLFCTIAQAIYDLRRSAKVKIESVAFAQRVFSRCAQHLPATWTDEYGHEWELARIHPKLNVLRYHSFFSFLPCCFAHLQHSVQSYLEYHVPKVLSACFDYCPLSMFSYGAGEYFAPHRDGGQMEIDGATGQVEQSWITVMIYLNDGAVDGLDPADYAFVGGGLAFLSTHECRLDCADKLRAGEEIGKPMGTDTVRVALQTGSVVAFEHGLLHEGEPVTSGRKYAIRTDVMYRLTRASPTAIRPGTGATAGLTVRCAPDGFAVHALPADSYKGVGANAGGARHVEALLAWQRLRGEQVARGLLPSVGTQEFVSGERVYALNPKYVDGTRLRSGPAHDAAFLDGVTVLNDTALDVVRVDGRFALVRKMDTVEGWIQLRNLTRSRRVPGLPRVVTVTDASALTGIDYYSGQPVVLNGIERSCELRDLVAVLSGASRRELNGIYTMYHKHGAIKTYANRLMWVQHINADAAHPAHMLFCDGTVWWIGYGYASLLLSSSLYYNKIFSFFFLIIIFIH
jgi:hypothetical protein